MVQRFAAKIRRPEILRVQFLAGAKRCVLGGRRVLSCWRKRLFSLADDLYVSTHSAWNCIRSSSGFEHKRVSCWKRWMPLIAYLDYIATTAGSRCNWRVWRLWIEPLPAKRTVKRFCWPVFMQPEITSTFPIVIRIISLLVGAMGLLLVIKGVSNN